MPVQVLNSVPTQNGYTESLTVIFPFARKGFAVHVFNASIMYQLAYSNPFRADDWQFENVEHQLAPSLSSFSDPELEGLPTGSLFKGIRIRSAIAGSPGVVTVA